MDITINRMQNVKILRILNCENVQNEPTRCREYESGNESRVRVDNNGTTLAYFLPWKRDTGFYIDIPCQNPEAVKFYTPSLTGCLIGIREIEKNGTLYLRICHWNADGFSEAELGLYDYWILPKKYEGRVNTISANRIAYYSYINSNPAAFYGKFENNRWEFTLYQTYNG
ncbi:hypothetical protein [Segatella copri]|uniref:hypothetical protein n=1 Tax=Segatella copri TaxID=165179 RepID=UPI001C46F986|nr:hypothetical protein [Segatella copri]MBW0048209.1 hypothetical protein [Segatella copri]